MYKKLRKRIVMQEGYESPSHSTHPNTGMYASVTGNATHAHARVLTEVAQHMEASESEATFEHAKLMFQKAERDYLGMKQGTVAHKDATQSLLMAGVTMLSAYEKMTCD